MYSPTRIRRRQATYWKHRKKRGCQESASARSPEEARPVARTFRSSHLYSRRCAPNGRGCSASWQPTRIPPPNVCYAAAILGILRTAPGGRSETVAESVFFDLSRPEQYPFGGRGAQSQVVNDVGEVPTAVDNTDNLDDAGTLPVEDKILAVRTSLSRCRR